MATLFAFIYPGRMSLAGDVSHLFLFAPALMANGPGVSFGASEDDFAGRADFLGQHLLFVVPIERPNVVGVANHDFLHGFVRALTLDVFDRAVKLGQLFAENVRGILDFLEGGHDYRVLRQLALVRNGYRLCSHLFTSSENGIGYVTVRLVGLKLTQMHGHVNVGLVAYINGK